MDYNKLKENQMFKNYKELCKFIGWKYYKGGDSKKAQFKELSKFCDYKMNPNHSIKIIKTKPLLEIKNISNEELAKIKNDINNCTEFGYEKLLKGMQFNSYKDLCEFIGWRYNLSNKDTKLKELEEFCCFECINNTYFIKDVYTTRKIKRKNKKDYLKLKYDAKLDNCKGVYCIKLENYIYIGSTIVNFKTRFHQHCRYINSTQIVKIHHLGTTHDMINTDGAEFHILWIADDTSTEKEVREMETNYIKQYCKDRNWIVVNKTKYAKWKGKRDNKYRTFLGFKINLKDYSNFIQDIKNIIINELSQKYDIKNK